MDVWLHVGTGKTGTSAVQVAFARHRETLASAGLLYPRAMDDEAVALEGGITSGNAKRLGWWAAPRLRQPDFDADSVGRWVDEALAEAGNRPVLFSSETLQAPAPDSFGPVLARLRAGGRRVRVLYLVRHALDHAVAGYAQGLKVGDPPPRAHDLADHLTRAVAPFERQLANLESLVGAEAVTVRLYDTERLGEGLARNLLRCIDPAFAAALPADAAPDTVNRSPTGIEIALYERIARHPELAKPLTRLATRGMMNAAPPVLSAVKVPEASFDAFAARNGPVVAAVNARWFGGAHVLKLSAGRIRIGAPDDLAPRTILDTAAALMAGVVHEAEAEAARLRAQIEALQDRNRRLEARRPQSEPDAA